jgi:hypothetical protein
MTLPDGWIGTAELFSTLPVEPKAIRKYIRLDFLDDPKTPEAIPVHQAVAVAAAAQARARNVTHIKRVFDLVVEHADSLGTHLLVIGHRSPLALVPVDGFEPVPAVVIDLPELLDLVLAGGAIPG